MNEPNESKVANLLASLGNLPADYIEDPVTKVLIDCVKELQKQIEEKASIKVGYDHGQGHFNVVELRMNFMGEEWVWFEARTKDGQSHQTLCLKGEV